MKAKPNLPWWREHSLILGLAAVIALAAWHPEWGAPQGDLRSERWSFLIPPLLFLISGLVLPSRHLGKAAADWRQHLFTQGFSLVALPLLFAGVAHVLVALHFSRALALGLTVLGALSTTTTSAVVLTRASGGDEAGALFNATLGSLLGIVVSPGLILMLTGYHAEMELTPVMRQLAQQILAPLLLGQALRIPFETPIAKAKPWLGRISLATLLAMIWVAMSTGWSRGFQVPAIQITGVVAVVVALHAAALGLVFVASSWKPLGFDRSRRTAILLCATQKSAALGVPLLFILFGKGESTLSLLGLILLPLLVYHPLQLFSASLLVPHLARWNREG